MKPMNKPLSNFLALASMLAALFVSPGAWSQSTGQQRTSAAAPSAGATWTQGEVKKIDKAAGKITFKHGDIINLGMPGMTMTFTAKDAHLLDKVKVGDQVKFVAGMSGNQYIVTAIEPQP
jgi:Cu(I)/Ag(I) efflux system periplasmic protein CusF